MKVCFSLITLTLGAILSLAALAGTPAEDLTSAQPTIEKANSDWVPALQAGDIDRATEPYADDAVWVLPDAKTFQGKAEIKEFLKSRMSPPGRSDTGGNCPFKDIHPEVDFRVGDS